MRLAIFSSGSYPFLTHGAEIGIFYLAKQLAQQGNQVTLYLSEYTPGASPVEKIVLPRGMSIVYYRGRRIRFIYNLSFIAKSVLKLLNRQSRPALVVVNIPTVLSLTTAYTARRLLHVPYLVIIHGPSDIEISSSAIKKLQCFLINEAARIVCVSKNLVSVVTKECMTSSYLTAVIPNGYDEVEIRQTLASTPNEQCSPELAFVGSLDENKDPLTLLRSFKVVSMEMPEVRLNIVGTGPLESKAHEFVEKEQLQSLVTFHNAMSHLDLLRLLARCSLLVITSHREGMPTTVIEALALGKPIVATAAGGIVEIVRNDLNGYVVPIGGVDALRQVILRILRDEKLRARLSSGAAGTAISFSWSHIGKSYEKLFKSVLNGTMNKLST